MPMLMIHWIGRNAEYNEWKDQITPFLFRKKRLIEIEERRRIL